MEAADLKYMTNAALLAERERFKTRISGGSRAARYDKSLRASVEEARRQQQLVEDEIARRGIDDFLQQVPLL